MHATWLNFWVENLLSYILSEIQEGYDSSSVTDYLNVGHKDLTWHSWHSKEVIQASYKLCICIYIEANFFFFLHALWSMRYWYFCTESVFKAKAGNLILYWGWTTDQSPKHGHRLVVITGIWTLDLWNGYPLP